MSNQTLTSFDQLGAARKASGAQSGRTTRQMQDAPQAAVYLWPLPGTIGYARALARHIGRNDLTITPITGWQSHGGDVVPVIDHACWETHADLATEVATQSAKRSAKWRAKR